MALGNQYLADLSAFIAFGIATVTHTILAVLTRGRFYLRPGIEEDAQASPPA